MNATEENVMAQVSFKERELRELLRTLEQVQEQDEAENKVRFLRVLASQAQAYAVRLEAGE
jgi:hypothetical protein